MPQPPPRANIANPIPSLLRISLAPGAVPDEHRDAITHYRRHLEVIGREGSLPIILYSYFGLDPSTGRYTYFNPSIGPAPHIEEPTPQRH